MSEFAPGWRITCPQCGRSKPYGKYGIRIGAASIGKRTLAWCAGGRRFRWARVEPTADREPSGIRP